MTDTTERPIIERLQGYNPPDRTIDEQRQIAVDIQDALAALLAKDDEIARLRAPHMRDYHYLAPRVKELEADNASLRAQLAEREKDAK